MVTEIIKEMWTKTPITNGVRYVHTVGINAVTIYDSKSYFFLFSDIDTKDKEVLQKVLMFYRRNNLTVYYYHTKKGYHVISPVLLPLRRWISLVDQLKEILSEYKFGTIRYTPRYTDGKILYLQQWNTKKLESYDLIFYLHKKFDYHIEQFFDCWVSTKLEWITYNQLKTNHMLHLDCKTCHLLG